MADNSLIKELRELTGAGMMDIKDALSEANDDKDKALDILRKKGKLNPDIHSEKDTIDNINFDYCTEHAKLGLSFVVETAMM